MFCALFSPRDSFTQCVRGKLAKLEQELVEAHLQAVQSWENQSYNNPVRSEHYAVSPFAGQVDEVITPEHIPLDKVPLIDQSSAGKRSTFDDVRGGMTNRSNGPLAARSAPSNQVEEYDTLEQPSTYRAQAVALSHPKRKMSFDAWEPIDAKVSVTSLSDPAFSEPIAKIRDGPASSADDDSPSLSSQAKKKLSFEPVLQAQGQGSVDRTNSVGSLSSALSKTRIGGESSKRTSRSQEKRKLNFEPMLEEQEPIQPHGSMISSQDSLGRDTPKSPRSRGRKLSFDDEETQPTNLQGSTTRGSIESVGSGLSSKQSLRFQEPAQETGSGSVSMMRIKLSVNNAELGYEDSEDPESLELTLRPQWIDAGGERMKKSRFATMVNQMLFEEQETKRKSTLNQSIRKRLTMQSDSSASGVAGRCNWCQCIIHPFSKSWLIWELCGSAILVHDIVFVPMQVFDMPASAFLEIMEWLTTLYWTLTFILTFFVSFQRDSEATFVTDRRQIMIHYMKGWFIFDLFLVGSDWAGYAIEVIIDTSDDSLRSARMARMARLGRLFRVLRLLRLMRVGEMLQRVERLIDSEYLSICFLIACNVVAIFFLAHMAACLWFVIGDNHGRKSWLHTFDLKAATVSEQYIQSLGWSLSTLLGADVTEVIPETMVEFSCALVILLIGTIAVSLVFSSTTAAMTRLQQLRAEDKDATFKLKKYLRQNKISSNLEARVLRYVDIAKSVHAQRISSDKVTLLNILSGPLRLSLQLELHAPHLTLHPFFKLYYMTNAGAMGELCLTAVGFIYLSRSDALFQTFSNASHTYFLVSGVMVYRRAKGAKSTRRIIKIDKGNNFSEAALWTCWVHRGSMKSLIESQVLALDVLSFCDITESHHDVFLEACEYAENYVLRANDTIEEGKYIWDVASELMYAGRGTCGGSRTSDQEPGYMNMLKEAEDISAELMDAQSDSDSEDEALLKAALKRGQSFNSRSSNKGTMSCNIKTF